MQRKTIIILAVVVIALGAGGIVAYFDYQNRNFVSTDDARVAADVATVSPQIVGNLISWNTSEGSTVQAGQVLGRQDLGDALRSGALSPQNLEAVGGVMAEKALLRAPITGEIIKSNAVVGETAAPGMVLAIVGDTNHLYVSANIKESSILRIKVGQYVDVHIDALPGKTFQGTVQNIGNATASTFSLLPSQNDSGNYTKVTQVIPVKIAIATGTDTGLMIGMNASVRIHLR